MEKTCDIQTVIADAVREFRDKAEFSQWELAKRSGVSRATIAAIEGGRYDSTKVKTLHCIAQALGVHVSELLGAVDGDRVAANSLPTNQDEEQAIA